MHSVEQIYKLTILVIIGPAVRTKFTGQNTPFVGTLNHKSLESKLDYHIWFTSSKYSHEIVKVIAWANTTLKWQDNNKN